MTTKQASEIFNMDRRTIQQLCKEGKIHGVRKVKNQYEIPDETAMIITDEDARAFLWQLLKFKNNPDIVLEESLADTNAKLNTWHNYLIEQGLVGSCEYANKLKELLERMKLTDKGFAMVVGKKVRSIHIEPHLNLNVHVACVNASVT